MSHERTIPLYRLFIMICLVSSNFTSKFECKYVFTNIVVVKKVTTNPHLTSFQLTSLQKFKDICNTYNALVKYLTKLF